MIDICEAFVGAEIHDGQTIHDAQALVVERDGRLSIRSPSELPADCPIRTLAGGLVTPGFVDLQVNGGGGVMFNDNPSVETLHKIAAAHAVTGTKALLPTLITDAPSRTLAAIDAVASAIKDKIEGIVGIHLEGPHLSAPRKGAHDANLIRPMEDEDLALLLTASEKLPNVMITVAPESATITQIKTLSDAGVIVSLGHTGAGFETCMAYFDAGARCATHLFNAMSQLRNRDPGLVGAALTHGGVFAGLIADGIHVHPATVRLALAAKDRSEQIFLVTDSMATAGSNVDSFLINDREVFRKNGKLTLKDGTLAGADLEMAQAMSVMVNSVGDSVENSVARATSTPASMLRDSNGLGSLTGNASGPVYFEDGFENPKPLLHF